MSTPSSQHEGAVTRTFVTLGSGDALARIIAFGAFVYLARALGAEAFGTLELAAAIVIYGNRIVDLGFDLGLGVREIAAGDDSTRPRLLTTALGTRSVAAVVVVGSLAGAGLWLLPSPEGEVLALYGLTLFAVALGTRWVHLGMDRSRLVAGARVLGELIMAATVLMFVRNADDLLRVPVARLVGDLVAAGLLLVGSYRLVRRRSRFDGDLARSLVPRAIPLVGGAIFGLMIFNADLVFLRVFEGRAAVGHYAAAYALTSFVSNLGIAYALALLPTLTRLADRPGERNELYRTAHAQVTTVSLAIATGGALLAAPIVALVFGDAYAASALPLALVLWSVPLALLRDMPVTALMSDGLERPIVRLTGQAAAINIALNAVLVPAAGMAGAAIATVVTELCRWRLAVRAARPIGLEGPPLRRYWRGIFAAAVMAGILFVLRDQPLWVTLPTGAGVWALALTAVGGIRRNERGSPELRV
ncbi:MAG: oligosaccharide flippase family protein [Gemmatimonadota bacterium]|nr:oligosaccharide flippase family protein [Gemmatimonadota bacterium]